MAGVLTQAPLLSSWPPLASVWAHSPWGPESAGGTKPWNGKRKPPNRGLGFMNSRSEFVLPASGFLGEQEAPFREQMPAVLSAGRQCESGWVFTSPSVGHTSAPVEYPGLLPTPASVLCPGLRVCGPRCSAPGGAPGFYHGHGVNVGILLVLHNPVHSGLHARGAWQSEAGRGTREIKVHFDATKLEPATLRRSASVGYSREIIVSQRQRVEPKHEQDAAARM